MKTRIRSQSPDSQHLLPGTQLPAAFLARMQALLGEEEYGAFLATYEDAPRAGLRVNTLKLSPERLASLVPFQMEPLAWPPGSFLVDNAAQPGRHPYHAAGLFYLQDPSAMVPAALLAPRPGDRVLDLSAAPGGKATHLAALLGGTGMLVANEIHPQRVWDLAENLERWGARNAVLLNESPERIAGAFPEFFDRVLVDAPCSGEGMLRRSEAARSEWAPELVQGCATRQSTILDSAAQTVRPDGLLAYVTCTFAPEEDEGTLARFLRGHPEFALLHPPPQAGFAPGRPDWLPVELQRPDLARAVRLWPHRYPGEGHFVALLRRASEPDEPGLAELAEQAPRTTRAKARGGARAPGGFMPLSRAQRDDYEAFCARHLTGLPAAEDLAVTGTYLYRLPPDLPDVSGLRVIHPGWWLGSFKKERFEPSHALALALHPEDVRRTVDLAADRPDVQAYLRGETLRQAGEDGWVLVTVSGYPLGWAKRVSGWLKSHYPRGLRRH